MEKTFYQIVESMIQQKIKERIDQLDIDEMIVNVLKSKELSNKPLTKKKKLTALPKNSKFHKKSVWDKDELIKKLQDNYDLSYKELYIKCVTGVFGEQYKRTKKGLRWSYRNFQLFCYRNVENIKI